MTARSSTPSRLLGVVLGLGSLAMLALSGFVAAEEAGGACKGLAKDACDKAPNCSWVSGYTTKAGKTVEALCRNKATAKEAAAEGKKPATAEATPAPKATPAPAAPTTATTSKAPTTAPATPAPTPAPKAAAPAATPPASKSTPAASGKDSGGKT